VNAEADKMDNNVGSNRGTTGPPFDSQPW
jgi:hypothetical protein